MSLRDIVIGVSPGVRGPKGDAGDAGRAATFNWAFSTQTSDADPGGGSVAFNNSDPALVTEIYLDDQEAGGGDVTAWLDLLTATGNTDNRGELHFQATGDAGRFARFQVTGTVSSGVTYRRVSVTYIAHAGTFTADETLAMALYRVGAGQAATIEVGTVETVLPSAQASVTNVGTAGAATFNFQIPRGFTGDGWDQWKGEWTTATAYVVNDVVENNGSSYIVTANHTSDASTEPGVGVDWETVWNLVAAKGAPGTMSGPASSVAGNFASFADASGDVLADSGVPVTALDDFLEQADVFGWVDPTVAAFAGGDITCDLQNGARLFFTRTLAGAEELQAPANAPIGATFYLLVTPGANTLTFAAGYEGPGDTLPSVTNETLLAIVVAGASRALVHVVGSNYGDGA